MIARKNESDQTYLMCVPGAVAVARRRCPMTKLHEPTPTGARQVFTPAGYLDPTTLVVVCDIHPTIENLIEVMTPKGETRFVMAKFLRFSPSTKESKCQ